MSDVTDVLPEVQEMVDKRLVSKKALRDFLFLSPVRFWAGMDPGFFSTAIERTVQLALSRLAGKPHS